MFAQRTDFSLSISAEDVANGGETAGAYQASLNKNPKSWTKIPMLNYAPLHQLKEHSLVRFRGMVQDMQDPEIFLERYEVKDKNGSIVRIQNGKYRDFLVLNDGEYVDHDSADNVHAERRSLYVVSVPGLNKWAVDYEKDCTNRFLSRIPEENQANPRKRPAGTGVENMETDADLNSVNGVDSNKRQCGEQDAKKMQEAVAAPAEPKNLLNSPIPSRPGTACMVKIYAKFDEYKLNSLIDVVGFLSMNPALDADNMDLDEMKDFHNADEMRALNPPPYLMPRLHVIAIHHLPHHNPLLDERFLQLTQPAEADINMIAVQKELRTLLTLCLYNDGLAADYLLSHLVSTIYNRSDYEIIGKFALNIFNLPKAALEGYTKQLYEILELLLPASHYVPLSLQTLNTQAFVPKKDYQTSRLVSGLLQLADHTHLVLDETQLQQGRLDDGGCRAVQNISHLIKFQQMKYDFQYYTLDFNTDIPVLVLSEGRSMLPHDFAVPLDVDDEAISIMPEALRAAHHFLTPVRLDKFRRFITKAKTFPPTLKIDDVMVQHDFLEMRKRNPHFKIEDMHSLLVLSRSLAISRGKAELDRELWELTKMMETNRQERLQKLNSSTRVRH